MPEPTTYVITASHPDGTPYRDEVGQATGRPSSVAAYGDQDRDWRVALIEAAGLTPHVRPA